MNLYSDEVRKILSTRPWPKGVVFDVAVINKKSIVDMNYLELIFYRENINSLEHDAKMKLFAEVNNSLQLINSIGCPTYLRVAEGDGRTNKTNGGEYV